MSIVPSYSNYVILNNTKGTKLMSVESLIHSKEFEQKIPLEIERKFLPLFPERLLALRAESRPIE